MPHFELSDGQSVNPDMNQLPLALEAFTAAASDLFNLPKHAAPADCMVGETGVSGSKTAL